MVCANKKLNYKKTFYISLTFLSICAFWQLYDSTIPQMLTNTFGASETVVGIIMSLDNIIALVFLYFFGNLSDKTNSPFGKRTPYIFFGTIISTSFMVLLSYSNKQQNFQLFFLSIVILLFSMSAYRAPAVALMPDFTPKPFRSKANSIINLMGTVGCVITLYIISIFKPGVNKNYVSVFIFVALIMIVSTLISILSVKEYKLKHKRKDQEYTQLKQKREVQNKCDKNLILILMTVMLLYFAYNAVSTTFSRYTYFVWNDTSDRYAQYLLVTTIIASLCYMPIGIISSKIGNKNALLIGISFMMIAFMIATFIQNISVWAYFVFALVGIGWSTVLVNAYPMVVQSSDSSNIGKYTGLYYTFSMSAQVITPILSGFLIENTPFGYKILFPYSLFFTCLAFIIVIFMKERQK